MSSKDLIVFFFKQKTAYEMRISDWSSDVCSSDLAERAMEAVRRDARVILEAERTIGQQPPDKGGAARRVADRQQQQRAAAQLRIGVAKGGQNTAQIGRASCRERVGQSV